MYSSAVLCAALLNLLHVYFAALPIRTVIGTSTIVCVAQPNVRHLYFTALFILTFIEPITIVRTHFITPGLSCTYTLLP